MGNQTSAVRILAPVSFIFDFAAQQYGIFSKPNMLDIHNQNIGAFSPNPYFIPAFFAPQQLLQLFWLYKLTRPGATGTATDPERLSAERYAWIYTLGNFCIGTWMFFWNANQLEISNIFVTINTVSHVAYIATQLPPLNANSTLSITTHLVAKTFAGIGVLDLLHNTSAAYYRGVPPSTMVQALTGMGFIGAAALSDTIFGACLAYDLVALAVGQSGSWRKLLGAYALGTAAVIGARRWM
ncbi:hypothetical protein BDV98DRAFT_648834 [Pterulicium gracile]|uniref:Uncharacterized protein n=1 Tax=Pterulicium gracile TaxID=1884261 RepID=A0A5C3QQ32_9AGAR|nr:hypothetical protein BDV98DRAFT_648834 [Pterula gracilis]